MGEGPLLECVPNFSEGRDPSVIRRITDAVESVEGAALLDVDPGRGTNRTVVTFVGNPDAVVEAAVRAGRVAAEAIDMSRHHGAHRMPADNRLFQPQQADHLRQIGGHIQLFIPGHPRRQPVPARIRHDYVILVFQVARHRMPAQAVVREAVGQDEGRLAGSGRASRAVIMDACSIDQDFVLAPVRKHRVILSFMGAAGHYTMQGFSVLNRPPGRK